MAAKRIIKRARRLSKNLWPLTPWTIFFAALAIIFCAGVSALVIQHAHNSNDKLTADSASSTNQTSTNEQPSATPETTRTTSPSTSQQTTTKPDTQTAPASNTPKYSARDLYCIYGDSGKSALDDLYKQTSQALTGEVDSVYGQVNSHSITTSQGIDDLNSYITTANHNYASSYQTYLNGRNYSGYGCPVDVQPPTSIPLCDINGSLASCIDNIRNNDNAWGNLIKEL